MDKFTSQTWVNYAKAQGDFDLMKSIEASIKTSDDFKPSRWIYKVIGRFDEPIRVLDFGCGMGRNLAGMREETKWHLTGYDSKEMLARAKTYLDATIGKDKWNNLWLNDDWDCDVSNFTFDAVVATLVFQHIPELELHDYLADLCSMTDMLVVHGRRHNDHSIRSTWAIVADHFDLAQAPQGFNTEGAPDDHHLTTWTPKRHG